jgi:hypothetical protein
MDFLDVLHRLCGFDLDDVCAPASLRPPLAFATKARRGFLGDSSCRPGTAPPRSPSTNNRGPS